MTARDLILLSVSLFALTVGAEEAKAPSEVARRVFEKHDQSAVANKEIVTGTATFLAGASIGFHTHPGDESGFVLKGSIVLKTKGQPDRPVMAGESFFNTRGAVHSVVSGPGGATVLSTWIVDKGVPLAQPAQ